MTIGETLLSVEMGTFMCDGEIVLCDSYPSAALLAAPIEREHPQILRLPVRPGTYQVIYRHAEEDGPDSIPIRVDVINNETDGLKEQPDQTLRLTVEGGRIAIIDYSKIGDENICRAFRDEAADSILHESGIVITTFGDGQYAVDVYGDFNDVQAISILIDDDVGDAQEDEP